MTELRDQYARSNMAALIATLDFKNLTPEDRKILMDENAAYAFGQAT